MDLLHRLFELVAKPGIIGPHGNREADLLIAGAKPVGFIALIDEEDIDSNSAQKANFDNINRLNEQVEKGTLLSKVVRVDNFRWPDGNTAGMTVYHYCQPDKKEDMELLAANHEKFWKYNIDEDLPQDIGTYLGYTDNDLKLFNKGGYASLNPVHRFVMQKSHDIRLRCRIKTLLNSSKPEI